MILARQYQCLDAASAAPWSEVDVETRAFNRLISGSVNCIGPRTCFLPTRSPRGAAASFLKLSFHSLDNSLGKRNTRELLTDFQQLFLLALVGRTGMWRPRALRVEVHARPVACDVALSSCKVRYRLCGR